MKWFDPFHPHSKIRVFAMIRFLCPRCGRTIKTDDDAVGKTGKCKCGETVRVPKPNPFEQAVVQRKGRKPAGPSGIDQLKPVPPITPAPAPPTIKYPEAFVWWQQRQHGRTFPFDCPGCGTQIELRQRVTQSRRVCPGCGFCISIEAIDRQLDRMEPERQRQLAGCAGCGTAATVLIVACTVCGVIGALLVGSA